MSTSHEIILREDAARELEDYLKKRNAFLGRVVANMPTDLPLERMQEMIQEPALLRQALQDVFMPSRLTPDRLTATLTIDLSLQRRERQALAMRTETIFGCIFEQVMSAVDAEIRSDAERELCTVMPRDVGLTESVSLREFYFRALSDGSLSEIPLGLVPFVVSRATELARAPQILHIGIMPFAGRLPAVDLGEGQTVSVDYSHDRGCAPDTPFVFSRPALTDGRRGTRRKGKK